MNLLNVTMSKVTKSHFSVSVLLNCRFFCIQISIKIA